MSQKPREGDVSTGGRNRLSNAGVVRRRQQGKIIIGDLDKGIFGREEMSRIGVGWVANGTETGSQELLAARRCCFEMGGIRRGQGTWLLFLKWTTLMHLCSRAGPL